MAAAAASSSSLSLYEVLGIPVSADGNEIKAAYRRLVRTCHPDVVAMNQKEMSANEFMKIHAAYSTLSDPDKRANYDRHHFFMLKRHDTASTSSLSAAAPPPPPAKPRFNNGNNYGTRNWETDQCW